jgi:serine O-acetyltransferase
MTSFREEWNSLQEVLKADLVAHGLDRWNASLSIRRPEAYFQRLMRTVEFLERQQGVLRIVCKYYRYRLQRVSVRTGISFPPHVAGPGLSIAHYGSIVVNSKAKIGSFCRLHSGTNIGTDGTGGVPVIGDFVYIGPGAVIYGAIEVGDGAVIGANAVVNRDVAAGVTVAGSPARVISHRDSSSIMPVWFPDRSNR